MQPHTAPGTPAQLSPGSLGPLIPVGFLPMGVQGPFPQAWWFGESRGAFMCASILAGTVPTLATKLLSSQGVPSSIHLGIAAPLRAPLTTLFECTVLRVSTFAHSLKAAKLPYCRVTISSILQ